MKKLFILILFIFSSIVSNGQKKNIHILCNDSSLLKIEFKNKKFKILKYKFRNENLREEYKNKYNLNKVPYQSFYLTFVYYKKPEKSVDISSLKLTSIDEISSYKIDISHQTKIYFIVKNKCDSYNLYETTMEFEE